MIHWAQAFFLVIGAGILFFVIPISAGVAGTLIGIGVSIWFLKHLFELEDEDKS